MEHSNLLNKLKNNLIVSCQPVIGGALDKPEYVAATAKAVIDGGAKALRIEGVENLKAVRKITQLPIIGLIKRDLEDSEIRITPFKNDVEDLIEHGADIVAIDATLRPRPETVKNLIAIIKNANRLAMADCATIEDAEAAAIEGADILATTMSGYTGKTIPIEPDLELLKTLSKFKKFIIAEGRYHQPEQAKSAIISGADAVVIGSAITRPEHITGWFAAAVNGAVEANHD